MNETFQSAFISFISAFQVDTSLDVHIQGGPERMQQL